MPILPLLTAALLATGAGAPPSGGALGSYRTVAGRIIEAVLADDGAWKKLEHLCDRIGARISGSPAQVAAAAWAKGALAADGHEGVHTEEVKVPHWVRGAEEATLLAPV